MDDLTDSELIMLGGDTDGCDCVFCRANAEIRRHRATILRLEEWALWLESAGQGSFNWPIAAELRSRIKGDSK